MDNPIIFAYTLDTVSFDEHFGIGCSGTSIVLNASANGSNDFYNGCVLTFGSESRTITDYTGSSHTATIDSAFSTNPTSSNTYQCQMQLEVNALSVPGFDDADQIDYWPDDEPVRMLNGDWYSNPPQSYNRRIRVLLGIVDVDANRQFIHNFHLSKYTKTLIYKSEELKVLPTKKTLEIEWYQDVESMKIYDLTYYEQVSRTTKPTSWT